VTTDAERGGLFGRSYLLPTIGMVAIAGVAAFQSLAMTTIMPVISADLHGEALYSLSFAAPLAAGLPGMVLAGNWSDRSGGRVVGRVSALLFAIGTAIVMTSTSMPMFLGGRLLEGFGAGAVDVVLYVIVARLYPDRLHPAIFAGFAGAWVVPALVGPALAGLVTDAFGWHWVFAGALAIAVLAFAVLVPSLSRLEAPPPDLRPPWRRDRIVWSVVAAVAVLLLTLTPDLPIGLAIASGVVGVGLAAVGLRPLLPTGTYRPAPGLPTVIAIRGLVAAAFLGSEAYVPYLLQAQDGLSPSLSGVALTVSALSWAAASWVHGRVPERILTARRTFGIGLALVVLGVLGVLGVAAGLPAWLAMLAWFVAGAGMGIVYPRTSTLTLRFAGEGDDGFASSALTIADSAGSVVGLAVAGVLFTSLGGREARPAFGAVFAVMAIVGVLAALAARRLGPVPVPRSEGTPSSAATLPQRDADPA
jgi:MFS family permease